MIASDVADLYVSCRAGEPPQEVLLAVRRCAEMHGWACRTRSVPVAPFLPPLGEGDYLGIALDPPPPAAIFAQVVGGSVGDGRKVRLAYFDALLREWQLSGGEWGFAQRGLTTHDLLDTQVAMTGSYFALLPDRQAPIALHFGSPQVLAATIRCQTLLDRGDILVFERVEVCGGKVAANGSGPAFAGTLPLDTAADGTFVAIVEDHRLARHRLAPGAFADAATAREAYFASNEVPGLRVLLARLALRASLQ